METIINKQKLLEIEKQSLIAESFAEKKGRELFGNSPYACYISINGPKPDLSELTTSFFEELMAKTDEAFLWAMNWDKSIVAVTPENKTGCSLVSNQDIRSKLFIPVSTTKVIETNDLVANLPDGSLAVVGVNESPMTVEAFLISYFHMVNELIWDMTIANSGNERPTREDYGLAVQAVASEGFSVVLLSEKQIVDIKKQNPSSSIRIYGSKVNARVPQMMGMVIK